MPTSEFKIWPSQGYEAFLPDRIREEAYILIKNSDNEMVRYSLKKLYIVNGELMHRDWFLNTSLGHITVAIEKAP